MKNIFFVFVVACFLTACSTSVVTEEERALPTETTVIDTQPRQTTETQPLSYKADLSQSLLSFVGKKGSLISHEGKFETYDFNLTSSDGIANAQINLSIDLSSMKTDSDRLTQHLLDPDFFDTVRFPQATFASTSIVFQGNDVYAVTGDLTMKGVTKEITFVARITDTFLMMEYNLDRTLFAVGEPPEGIKSIDGIVPISAKIVFQ